MTRQAVRYGLTVAFVGVLAGRNVCAQSVCPAQAQADALEERGVALRNARSDQEALAVFQQAQALCHGARALLRIGLAEAALGQWVDAERHVTEALGRTDDPWITANRTGAQQQLGLIGRHVGSLELPGSGATGEVWIGTRRVGTWPTAQPLRVPAGTVVVTVRATGYIPVTRTVEVPAGGFAREPVDLVPQPTAAATPVAVAPVIVAPTIVAPVQTPVTPQPVSPSAGGSALRTVGWVAVIGGGVALATGAVALALREGSMSSFNSGGCTENNGVVSGGGDCSSSYGSVNTLQSVALGALVGGGVLVVAGGAMVLAAPSRHTEQPGVAWHCGGGPGTVGMACGATF